MFRVRWERRALDEFTRLWLAADASDRAELTAAASDFDRQLKANAPDVGESRADPFRLAFVSPLVATFAVDQEDKVAYVLHVWRYVPRRRR